MDRDSTNPITMEVQIEKWPLRAPFIISRGSKTEATVVTVNLKCGRFIGRGECVPYARYQESPEQTLQILLNHGPPKSRMDLQRSLPASAARNALDCAMWDLDAKRLGLSAAALARKQDPTPQITCFTISLDTPEAMAKAAKNASHLSLLKLKLGGEKDAERMRAVRAARPDARLLADANESWNSNILQDLLHVAHECQFELIEQPLPENHDAALAKCERVVPVCADESIHTRNEIPELSDRYDAINIKLDKAGGLTEALTMVESAKAADLKIMVGSMVATSLAVAPAMILAQDAKWVDLDGPLLLVKDRIPSLEIENGRINPPVPRLWG